MGSSIPAPTWVEALPTPGAAVDTWQQLRGAWQPVEAAVDAMAGRSKAGAESTEKTQREALLKVHQRLVELAEERGTAYGSAFEAYMLHAGARLEQERGSEAAAVALLGAVVFAIDAQQEPGAPAALRSMLAPAASVAAAILGTAQLQKGPARLALSGLMAALAALLLDCSKQDPATFSADLPMTEAALRCAVAAGTAAATRGSTPQRSALWSDLLPAAFKAMQRLGDLTSTPAGADGVATDSSMEEQGLLEGERWAFVKACGTVLGLALSATQNLRLDVSLSDALAPLDRQEVAQGAVTLAHQLGCCYRDRLATDPPPDEATSEKLAEVLGWLSKALQLLSLLLQHGGQMETFLDDGGVMSLCQHLAQYPTIHAHLPPGHAAHAVDCQVVELLTFTLNNSKRARELLTQGDQTGNGSGIKVLLAALGAAPGLQTLLADAVVHSQLARWTFKRSLLKCLEAAVLTTSEHRKEILANDGVGVIVRSCRWRPLEAGFKPKQEAHLVRANPAFVRGIAGNAFSCLCIASQNLDDDKSYWNQVASKLAEATSADELMSFHKWMPAGQDPAQVLLNTDKLSCSWGLHTALWRLLHPLTYNNKEQRAVFAANELYIRLAAAALSLPNSDEALTKGRVCAFKPTVMYILYNAAIIDDACRKQQLKLGVHERALELLCQSFHMAGEQDRRILKAAATSKRGKAASSAATAAASGAKDAKTFQAGVGGQADAASLLLEGLLLKTDGETRSLCRQLMQDGKLAAVQKALNNRIGSSYSESTLQTAERSFLKVLHHSEQAVSEQRQQQQQAAAAEAERLAAELLAAEEVATAKREARAAKQQQRQRAAKEQKQQLHHQAAAAAAAAATANGAGGGDDDTWQQPLSPAEGQLGSRELASAGSGGTGEATDGAVAADSAAASSGSPAESSSSAVSNATAAAAAAAAAATAAAAVKAALDAEQQQERAREAAAKEVQQQQGYLKLLREWEAAEASAAAEAAAALAAKKRSKKQQQREKVKEKRQGKSSTAASSAATTPAASPKAAARQSSGTVAGIAATGGLKVLAVPVNGSRPGSAATAASAASPAPAGRLGAAATRQGSGGGSNGGSGGASAPSLRPASAAAAGALPPKAPSLQPPLGGGSGGGPPMSFAAAAASGTGQTVGPSPAALAAAAAVDAPPPTPPRPPPAMPASHASTPLAVSPLLPSPQQQAALAEALQLQQHRQQQQPPQTPPRVLRTASAPLPPALAVGGAAASAPASAAPSVTASPQRSLFADMLHPLGSGGGGGGGGGAASAVGPAATVAAASAPQSAAPSGVASPTHPTTGHRPVQPLPPGYGFGGLGLLPQQQQHQQQQAGRAAAATAPSSYLLQRPKQHTHAQQHTQQQQQHLLGPLNPSTLEAALSKARGGGGGGVGTADEDGLGFLPFAVAEAALFDDSPPPSHSLPLSVAGFAIGDSYRGSGSSGDMLGMRHSQGQASDFSDMLSHMLPGGSPLKRGGPSDTGLNGAVHPRQPSSGSESGLGSGSLFGPHPNHLQQSHQHQQHQHQHQHQQQLSFAAAAAWAPRSPHSSLDSSGGGGKDSLLQAAAAGAAAAGAHPIGKDHVPLASSGSSGSEVQLPALPRYGLADGSAYEMSSAGSWLNGQQLV